MEIIENAIEKSILEKDVANLEYKIPALSNAKEKMQSAKNKILQKL